jgi:hypothetical protein
MQKKDNICERQNISFERFMQIISNSMISLSNQNYGWSEESVNVFREIYDAKLQEKECNLVECASIIGETIFAQSIEVEW